MLSTRYWRQHMIDTKRGPGLAHRLVRQMPGGIFLDFSPPLSCSCGGLLEVRDFAGKTSRDNRYETSCTVCHKCDCNGWPSQAQVIENSPEFFLAYK